MIENLSLTACEPIPILMFAWAGPSITYGVLLKSFGILAAIVFAKCLLFAYFADIGWIRGVALMALGNVVSTVIGVLIGGFMTATILIPFTIILLLIFAHLGGRTFENSFAETSWNWLSAKVFGSVCILLGFVSMIILATISASLLSDDAPLIYFALKAFGLFLILLCSIGLTIGWEAGTVLKLSAKSKEDPHRILTAAVRANLIVFFVVFLVGAIIAIPIRLRHPNFLWPGRL